MAANGSPAQMHGTRMPRPPGKASVQSGPKAWESGVIENDAGMPLSVKTAAGAAAFDAAVESYLASRADTPDRVRGALADDPEHVMARCLLGYLLRLAGDPASAARARNLQQVLAETVTATDWERRHVAALGLWLDDRLDVLMAHFEAILDDCPRDILALRMLHYLYFYDGDAARMRDSILARLDSCAGQPLFGYVRGMLAFALEESGDYAGAERHGRAAVAERPYDIWAGHAVAHVMQMQGRAEEGAAWIAGQRPHWREANNFRYHLYWHEALHHLARGEPERALAIYDADVGPPVDEDFYLDLCNAASLLLRLEVLGCDVGDRWTPLAVIAERHADDTELVFATLHYLMPLLRTRHPAATRLLAALDAWAERDTTQGALVREVARDAAAFLIELRDTDPTAAVRRFDALRTRLHRIGGSHAQRQLFDILRDAAVPPAGARA